VIVARRRLPACLPACHYQFMAGWGACGKAPTP